MAELFKLVIAFILLIGIYFLSSITLSRISVEKEQNDLSEVTIYLLSNGVHTDVVLPTNTSQFNWRNILKSDDTVSKDSTLHYTAFGWGDKGFYLETPTWEDLKLSTAFKAAFGLGKSAMHITFYNSIRENELCKAIPLSANQYLRLVEYIRESISINKNGKAVHINTSTAYGINDAFYEANGKYCLFKTCNTWVNNALKSCGQKACLWTPFEDGVFYHYK